MTGADLYAFLQRHRWTQQQAGKALGLHRNTISRLIRSGKVPRKVELTCWSIDEMLGPQTDRHKVED